MRAWENIGEGDELPELVDDIDVERVVAASAATWTFFGGHIDVDYAREVQGRKHVYLATGPVLGLIDAYVTRWLGYEAFLTKRSIRMVDSTYAGDRITLRGRVTRKWVDDSHETTRHLVEIATTVTNESGAATVQATSRYRL